MRRGLICCVALLVAAPAQTMEPADPLLATLSFDRLELTAGDGETGIGWDTEAWIGKDVDKLRFASEGEREDNSSTGNLRLLYSRAMTAFWDIGLGWRREFGHGQQWDAATIEFIGTLPWHLETRASGSVGESGQTSLWLDVEYEFNFGTRAPRWKLVPEAELYVYGKDDEERGIGSGLSSFEAGLRLHYEIRPGYSPYAGVDWTRLLGNTADLARAIGEDSSELRWVLGFSFWF